VQDLRRDAGPDGLWLMSARLGERVPVPDVRGGAYQPPPVTSASIPIEGEPVDFRVFTAGARWIAQGIWRGFAVELEGSAIEPADVALRLAAGRP
jgi:hypothetical protein